MSQPKQEKQNQRNNLVRGLKSINLIPPLTQEEAVVVESKGKLNVGAAVSLFVLFLLTLVIVGFNIFAKLDLNRKKDNLFKMETNLNLRENLLSSNEEILRRVNLYQKVESTTYSTKDIVVYLQAVSQGLATIDTIEITEGSNFAVSGNASTLTDVSKLWYVLGNDKFVESINLKTVVKDGSIARFNFEGKLKLEEFKEAKDQSNG